MFLVVLSYRTSLKNISVQPDDLWTGSIGVLSKWMEIEETV